MHILIAGGGYVGMYTALRLERRLRRDEARFTLVTPESFMTYHPFLPEAAAGSIEPRHVVVPLRKVLRRTRVVVGHLGELDHDRRAATVRPLEGPAFEFGYDHAVVALGSLSRVLPVPGLAEVGLGFKSVPEAIYLRNQVLSRMDAADSTDDPEVRRRALSFLFVGGGYAGVEALGELEGLARQACRYFQTIRSGDMRWVLVEASPRILPEIGEDLQAYAQSILRRRGIEIRLDTRLVSAEGGVMVLSGGESFAADTLVWTAGVRAHPLVASFGWPLDERGRVVVDEYLRVQGVDGAWAAGDCAAVPDPDAPGTSPPTAQHALRQAQRLGDNLVATLRGGELRAFRYHNLGALVSFGSHEGVARVLGLRIRGLPAWALHRIYHVSRIPTLNRKVRVNMDWFVSFLFKRDIAQLGSLQHPRKAFVEALGGEEPGVRP
jgi:NADH dehydrogenase